MRISDWSSDVCSSDLFGGVLAQFADQGRDAAVQGGGDESDRQHAALLPAHALGGDLELFHPAEDLHGLFVEQPAGIGEAQRTGRSEERRVGKECVSTFRSRWLPYP